MILLEVQRSLSLAQSVGSRLHTVHGLRYLDLRPLLPRLTPSRDAALLNDETTDTTPRRPVGSFPVAKRP